VACNFTHFVRWRVVLPPCKKKKKKRERNSFVQEPNSFKFDEVYKNTNI
jgi:hypothetical protein